MSIDRPPGAGKGTNHGQPASKHSQNSHPSTARLGRRAEEQSRVPGPCPLCPSRDWRDGTVRDAMIAAHSRRWHRAKDCRLWAQVWLDARVALRHRRQSHPGVLWDSQQRGVPDPSVCEERRMIDLPNDDGWAIKLALGLLMATAALADGSCCWFFGTWLGGKDHDGAATALGWQRPPRFAGRLVQVPVTKLPADLPMVMQPNYHKESMVPQLPPSV